MGNKKDKKTNKEFPFVSICTPTFNRRPFFPMIIKCFQHQDYPLNRMEWIIIDDGTDHIEDIVKDIPQVKYFKYTEKMSLGRKRNLMHEKSKGSIIVYMDDDDYYPTDRVSHAVDVLKKNPSALCAGSSEMYIYFKHVEKMYKFGPYRDTHATAATFAFRRELLNQTKYDDNAAVAEEKIFLKDYTIPFVQLDSMKTILVFSHIHNSFDKKKLLDEPPSQFVNVSEKTVEDFVKQPDIRKFFLEDIDDLLNGYSPGRPENKPDVTQQLTEITERRNKMMAEQQRNQMIQKLNEFYNENLMLKEKVAYLEGKIKELIQLRISDIRGPK
jgi:glycosyltransferase involved in cell wall biosynthesis